MNNECNAGMKLKRKKQEEKRTFFFFSFLTLGVSGDELVAVVVGWIGLREMLLWLLALVISDEREEEVDEDIHSFMYYSNHACN